MAGRTVSLAAVLLAAVVAGPAVAAEWGTIVPGTSTAESVRARYGRPTRVEPQKVEGYDTEQWVYEGGQAPAAIRRLIVEFGLLLPSGYRRDVVRAFRLEPRPGAFDRSTILTGWGMPTRIGREGDAEVFFYRSGLFVYFDQEGWMPRLMLFTMPQPPPSAPATPRP